MITSRWKNAAAPAATIRPPFEGCVNAVMARSVSPASRTLIGRTSTPSDEAEAWIAANWPAPAAMAGFRRNATRFTPGAISLSSSSHLPPKSNSYSIKPVALPPGRARVSTKPAPTGSATSTIYGFSISRFSASAPEIVYLGNTIVYLGNTNAPASADLRSARQCFLACTRQPTRDERLALSLQLSGPLLAAARALPVAPLRYEASSASIQGLAVVRRCCAPLVGALVPVRGIIGDGLRHGHAPGSTAN